MIVPASESTREVSFESSQEFEHYTSHGLLVAAYEEAKANGLFTTLREHIHVPMKTVTYSPLEKLTTLWASIVVGCDHTSEINIKLGAHERALAALFGFERFPDQSTVNRLLRAMPEAAVGEASQAHYALMVRHSRARVRRLRHKLAGGGGRVLFVDIDQHGLVVSGKQYELAEDGFFGAKRGHRGYQLTLVYFGGLIGEVFDEYFDPGDTHAGARIDDLLDRLERFCRDLNLPKDRLLIRADAQYGTPAIVGKIASRGFGFLVKGISPQRAKVLERSLEPGQEVVGKVSATGAERRVADLGEQTFVGKKIKGQGEPPRCTARTLLVRWQEPGRATTYRPSAQARTRLAEQEPPPPRECRAYLLTSLAAEHLPAAEALSVYDDRATIERHFRDEDDALGAHSVRTRAKAGAAVFQWMVAITANQLRWMKARRFTATPLEGFGLGRLIKQAMQVPAILLNHGSKLRVLFPQRHCLVDALVRALSCSTHPCAPPTPTPLAPPP
jgi:hypothetical protein